MAKKSYRVLRAHDGDRWYNPGDVREAHEQDVAHLVPRVLAPIVAPSGDRAAKKRSALANKMAKKLANKAA